jgi:nicotinamide phosphoribosyltransferase
MFSNNIILDSDSYKVSHYLQYPNDTEIVYSYYESRGGKFSEVVFFGLQYYIKEFLSGVVVTEEKIEEAKEILNSHFGSDSIFNEKAWRRIIEKHGGRLPIKIKAVPEGSIIPYRNVLMTIENTDPEFFWLTNYLETILSRVWYPSTVATYSHEIKKIITEFHDKTSESKEGIDFKLHDFGARGVSSSETAAIGGAAHLINFMGTDTIIALRLLNKYYYANGAAGFSIPASEHSTMTSWNDELKAYKNMLESYPKGLVACVSDSYDIFNACENLWGKELKEQILNREGTLIIRPDSGNPEEITLKVIEILGERFGYTHNSKGYKVLNPKVRIIQGDGIDLPMVRDILGNYMIHGWSAENIAFGSGGGLLQKHDRDTQKFAIKCSAIRRSGKWYDVFKEPVTDKGKASKKGRLQLVKNNNIFNTIRETNSESDLLETVFENGQIIKEYTHSEIKDNLTLN